MPANFVYVMRYGERLHKIGFSVSPLARLRALRFRDMEIGLIQSWERPHGDAQIIERLVHRALKPHRAPAYGTTETFAVSAHRAIAAIENVIAAVDGENERIAKPRPDFPQLISPAVVAFLPIKGSKRTRAIMERMVIHPGHIFDDKLFTKKLLRTGDTLIIAAKELPSMADFIERRGVHVQVI